MNDHMLILQVSYNALIFHSQSMVNSCPWLTSCSVNIWECSSSIISCCGNHQVSALRRPDLVLIQEGALNCSDCTHTLPPKSPYCFTDVNVRFSSLSGSIKRFFAGIPIFQTEAFGPGNIAFSRDSVGQISCLRLQPGRTVEVREHQVSSSVSTVGGKISEQIERRSL